MKAYAVVDLRVLGAYDWRLSPKNVWKVEQTAARLAAPQDRLVGSRADAMRRRYLAFREAHGYKPWKYYSGRERWTPLPRNSHGAAGQSRSKSRMGRVIGSCLAFFSASSNRRDRASSAVFLGRDRLLEECLTPRRFRLEDPLRIG